MDTIGYIGGSICGFIFFAAIIFACIDLWNDRRKRTLNDQLHTFITSGKLSALKHAHDVFIEIEGEEFWTEVRAVHAQALYLKNEQLPKKWRIGGTQQEMQLLHEKVGKLYEKIDQRYQAAQEELRQRYKEEEKRNDDMKARLMIFDYQILLAATRKLLEKRGISVDQLIPARQACRRAFIARDKGKTGCDDFHEALEQLVEIICKQIFGHYLFCAHRR